MLHPQAARLPEPPFGCSGLRRADAGSIGDGNGSAAHVTDSIGALSLGTCLTSRRFAVDVSAGQRHDLTIILRGQQVRVFLDNQPAGEYQANGFGHASKTSLAFAVPEAVDIDRLKVWKLR
jgi:hypothetical protein